MTTFTTVFVGLRIGVNAPVGLAAQRPCITLHIYTTYYYTGYMKEFSRVLQVTDLEASWKRTLSFM